MAKNGGFSDGGLMPFKDALDKARAELRKQDQSAALRGLLNTEEAILRYQDVILGIERRWDRLMRYRQGRSHQVRQWDKDGKLVKSEYFDKY